MRALLLGLVLLGAPLWGPGGVRQVMSFHFENPLGQIPEYTVDVNEDGTGSYSTGPASAGVPLKISAATVTKIFAGKTSIGGGKCETHLKNIAKTGKKTLTYHDNDEIAECVFNYSDDEKLNDMATTFLSIVFTIQEGDRLKHDHRYDHLGLDADLDSLLASAKSGDAIELQNIASVLQSIVDDDEIMSPSRRKAKSLLELAGVQTAPSAR
jgi:hypothetical protein